MLFGDHAKFRNIVHTARPHSINFHNNIIHYIVIVVNSFREAESLSFYICQDAPLENHTESSGWFGVYPMQPPLG